MIRFRPSIAVTACALVIAVIGCTTPQGERPPSAKTPIEHVIVVVGENISFDNLYGTYEPAPGQSVANLLSKGIVRPDGSPGPHVALSAQHTAAVRERYLVTPPRTGAFKRLPQPGTTYALNQPKFAPDQRFPTTLPNAPFPITRYADWMAAVGDPIHRFFQMWQQVDGGRHDLFVWVDTTSGEGSQKRDDPRSGTNQGGVAMGFYNMAKGDAPYFRELARTYTLADNYHQSVMGGTGANYIALGTGDAAPYLIDGKPATPPANQIENPNPRRGTNNWYTQSGYSSGSYVECADASQPGVEAIRDYLASLPYKVFNDGNCAPGAYYLVNNYKPGFAASGERQPLGPDKYVLPPQVAPNIGEALAAKGVSWKWYQGGRTAEGVAKDLYCDICDPFTHSIAVMTGPLKQNLVSLDQLERDLGSERSLPAVSFVTPPNPESGHPAYSYVARYEAFIKDLVAKVQAHPEIWAKTAILVTTDEGGGYYDSGYIQILDFFGDGTRIPFLAISPYAKPGVVDHTYYDHASILKFIELNWGLAPLSPRSRDNLPNPVVAGADPYVPQNRPAVGDLTNLFQF
jgi:acid phosphatase